ncbi:SDR family NAD(P)-dependent oxidoreductase [Bacillus sp. ICE1]|uniref:type I polyketide synthase n=1 Tax=Bacillus TaxID=1386 RepID=UPI001E4C497B|nr:MULTISPECIES: type I polyketide synthase [unclassified Bacillus (in: firmicutes)]MCC8305033.1 SDR family NAD(P)-dependent oxidoreductase [Bacillus sp. AF12]MDV9077530.1 type I polyketide synthase [Bacillus sp. ICE1]
MNSVQSYIFEQVKQHKLSQKEAKRMLKELKAASSNEDIAIIGISCRLPKANNTDEYWQNLMNGEDCKAEYPKDMINYIKPIVNNKGFTDFLGSGYLTEEQADNWKPGGYLEDVDKFDPEFFNISPKEAKAIDPSHRVLLETVWTAIEDAGYAGDKIYGSNTSLFVGKDHVNNTLYRYITESESTSMTGNWPGLMAGRINYLLNLKGSSMVLDSACSSGLLGVHLACNALKNKECDMSIVSGISLGFFPRFKTSKKSMMESVSDKVHSFDKDADGTFFSDGVAAVILKPLSKAKQDGDHIYAVIKGSAVNNDGASNGLTAPNAIAQEEVLVQAWENAQIDPETIQYIEAHGTGTKLGDPIEIKGISNAFSKYTDKLQFCGIGSVKSNIGHTVAVSGLASLIKIVLSMKHQVIPPSINFKEPNSLINFVKSPVFVTDKAHEWPKNNSPRRAGISSFGFVGTNSHVVIEDAGDEVEEVIPANETFEIFTLSAKTENSLMKLIKEYNEFFKKGTQKNVKHICYTANTGRGHYGYRLALIVKSYEELKRKIGRLAGQNLNEISEKGVYFSFHKVGSDRKQIMDEGEISLSEHRKMNAQSDNLIHDILTEGDEYLLLNLTEICNLYIRGAKVEWTKMYKDEHRKIVSLPTYQFERTLCWGEVKDRRGEAPHQKNISHPLIDQCLADSMNETIYSTTFNVNKDWVLSDHKIMGACVIPGTTYIEMGRRASAAYYKSNQLELRDIIFFTPLTVNEGENKIVHTIIKKKKECIQFIIASQEGETWITHAEGKAFPLTDSVSMFDLDSVRNDSNREKIKVNYENKNGLISKVFTFGPRWLNFKEVILGSDEQLAELKLADEFTTDLKDVFLHPALLDNAVNVFIGEDDDDSTFLPFSYKSVKIYSRMPQHFYAFVKKNASSKETKLCDIQLIDTEGHVFAEITDYVLKKVNRINALFEESSESLYQLKWMAQEAFEEEKTEVTGPVLLFKDNMEIYKSILEQLKIRDDDVIEVEFGDEFQKINGRKFLISGSEEDYVQLLHSINDQNISSIIHMSSISRQGTESLTDLEDMQNKGVYSLFRLVRGLSKNKMKSNINLHLISDLVTEVSGEENTINPLGAALFGLGRVISQEFQNVSCKAIDIDEHTSPEIISKELRTKGKHYQVAFRDGKRYISRLDTVEPIKNKKHGGLEIKENGVYMITGGTGGIGLEIAKHLAGKHNVNAVLLNRSKLPDQSRWDDIIADGTDLKLCRKLKSIRAIESMGSKVDCYSCEVSDLNSMGPVIEEIKQKYGTINGVFHCAGVAGDGFLFRKEANIFKEVLAPKINGTWVINHLTRDVDLDFTILFSSINSIFGGAGQGDYTAANAYLDSFAYMQNKQGKNTLSINWPAWDEVGIAVDYGITDESSIFRLLTVERAISVLEEIASNKLTNIIPGTLNMKLLAFAKDELSFELSEQIKNKLIDKNRTKNEAEKRRRTDTEDIVLKGKGELYSDTEKSIAQMYSMVLDMQELDLYESFSAMGGDSIMATQLLKLINEQYPDIVDISDIFTYSSVVELSEYIDKQLNKESQQETEEDTAENRLEQELNNLFDDLENGKINIQEGLKILEN